MINLPGRNFAGFLFFMSLSAVGLANIAFWAFQGNTVFAFVSALTAWTSYLFAHYMTEGVFIDGNEDDQDHKIRPGRREEVTGTVLGTAVLVSGMGLGVYALRNTDLSLTVLAALIFHTGYTVAHYAATREVV